MREFTKSLLSYSLAVSLFSLKQMQNLLTPTERGQYEGPATKAFSAVTNATTDQFGETLGSAFRMFDNVQRGLVGLAFSFLTPPQRSDRFDRTASAPRRSDIHWNSEPLRGDDDAAA